MSAADLVVAAVLLVVLVTLILVLAVAAGRQHHTSDLFSAAGRPLLAVVTRKEATRCVHAYS
jgi:hypothetical protein